MSGYTKTPNRVYATMPEMKEVELRCTLALIRQTYGFHRNEAKITIADFIAATGLSKQGVINGLRLVYERGFFAKGHKQSTFIIPKEVNTVDYSDGKESTRLTNTTNEKSTQLTKIVNTVDLNSQHSRPSTSGLKKTIKKDKENNNKHAAWFAFFEGLTGFTPPHESVDAYQDSWVEPLEAIIKQSKDNKEVEDRITYAVMEMRRKNFTLKSFKSIKTFALNFQEKTDNGIEPAWLQVKEHVKQNKPPVNGKLLTAVRAVGWPALKTMNSYTEPKLKERFTEAYHAAN